MGPSGKKPKRDSKSERAAVDDFGMESAPMGRDEPLQSHCHLIIHVYPVRHVRADEYLSSRRDLGAWITTWQFDSGIP